MNIDLDIEPERPAPEPKGNRPGDRTAERPGVARPARDRERTGHRREYDAREPRREMSERVDGMMRDIGTFRTIALTDLIKRQFDGHPHVARNGLMAAERSGWIERQKVAGPKGGSFTVVVATPAGVARAAELWAKVGRPDQRVLSGAVKPSELRHDCTVYRAAWAEAARIEAAGGRVVQVRVDAELKGTVAAAAELDLPIADGQVLFPDAQIEYVDGVGRSGRCNVEVASEHYRGGAVRAKAGAGFAMYATAGKAADAVRRVLAGGGGRSGAKRGGRAREIEVFEI